MMEKKKKSGRNSEQISQIMRNVHSSGTKPENSFLTALQSAGISVDVSRHDVTGKPDFVLNGKHIAVFIDGDFWHGRQWLIRGLTCLEAQFQESKNSAYWVQKIRRTISRDIAYTAQLTDSGWKVLRIWESDLKKNVESYISILQSAVEDTAVSAPQFQPEKKTAAEFFAGIGLMRAGLEQVGWKVVFANDIDIHKQNMYIDQFSDDNNLFVLDDIYHLRSEQIPNTLLATASFPCNDLSLAGKRAGLGGQHSSAFWGFIHILSDMAERRPALLLIENVPGFLTSHNGEDFITALQALNDLGYSTDAFMVNASHFTPQSRLRLFIAATRDDYVHTHSAQGSISIDALQPSAVRPTAVLQHIRSNPQIHWRIQPLPDPPLRSQTLADIAAETPENEAHWWSSARAQKLLDSMQPRSRSEADAMAARPEWSYAAIFLRTREGKPHAEIRTDGLAGCLRTPRGGSARQIIMKAGSGNIYMRLLTPLEAAKLQGVGGYRLNQSNHRLLFGFGDAVCAPVITWIAQYYFEPLVQELIHGKLLIGCY